MIRITLVANLYAREMSWRLVRTAPGSSGQDTTAPPLAEMTTNSVADLSLTTWNLCAEDGDYLLTAEDSWGDGWHGGH
eukprot:9468231-Pyramimonas_sp.AAC.1